MDGCFTITLKDFLTVLIQGGMFCVAIVALETWRRQLQGTTKHQVALEIATEVKALTYLFFEARSPWFEGWEFPDDYNLKPSRERTADDEVKAWEHVYNNRWKHLHPQILKVAQLRAKVGAVLGDNAADAAEKVARAAKKLEFWWGRDLEQKSAGADAVAARRDQNIVDEVRQSIVLADGTKNDKYSREFSSAADSLLALAQPHFK